MPAVWSIVLKGTQLGLILFLLMINDLSTQIPTYNYVDDSTLYRISNDQNDGKLQEAANEIVASSRNDDMRINHTHTKQMVISFSRLTP